jgi:RHS repeat-associated protein
LTRESGFELVQHVDGPFGRCTTLAYDGSNNIRHVEDPSGRITTLMVNGNNDLVKLVTPELCTTSLVYDANHNLITWIDPLGFRTTYVYDSGSAHTTMAVVQPLGQRTTYLSFGFTLSPPTSASTVVVSPTLARTTINVTFSHGPTSMINPVGHLGYYEDSDTLQYYLQARYYNPSAGRFASRDPIKILPHLDLYNYCRENPLQCVDPSGA